MHVVFSRLDKLDSSFSRSRSSSMSSLDNITTESIQCLTFGDSYTKKSGTYLMSFSSTFSCYNVLFHHITRSLLRGLLLVSLLFIHQFPSKTFLRYYNSYIIIILLTLCIIFPFFFTLSFQILLTSRPSG